MKSPLPGGKVSSGDSGRFRTRPSNPKTEEKTVLILSTRKLLVALGYAGAAILAGCGGDGSSTADGPLIPTKSINGVAASGAAFTGGVVSVIDSRGTVVGTSAPVDGTGVYSVALAEGATPAFVLVATRASSTGEAETLVSVVESADVTTANVTPITTLIASRLSSSGDPSKLAEELASGKVQITPEAVAATVQDVKAILEPLLAASGASGFDPLRDSFSTDGTGYDRLLDSIRITILPSGTSANIEIALKSVGGDTQSPPTIVFTSNQPLAAITADNQIAPTTIGGTTIDTGSLTEEGLSVRIAALMQRLTTCYGVPLEQRVAGATASTNEVVGAAVDVIAAECRGMFVGNDPSVYKHNGSVVQRTANNQGAFTSLFRRSADGVVFSQGSYEFTRGNGDYVVGYKTRDAQGGESFGALVARKSDDGALRLIGNQYVYPGHVVAYHQKRNFVTLGQDAYSYFSTGYTPQIANLISNGSAVFDRVEVTSPKGTLMVLRPDAGQSQLVFHRNGAATGTNFIRLRTEYVDGSTTRPDPSVADTPSLVFAPTRWTEDELVRIASAGSWKFDYFLAGNTGSVPDATQHYRTRSRALSIGELRTRGFAELVPQLVADVVAVVQPAGQPFPGQLIFDADDRAVIGTTNGGPGWSVQAGQMAPTSIQLYGSYAGKRFNDSIGFASTTRSITVPCTPQSAADTHCFNGGPGYAAGAALSGLHLWSGDATGREFANFYAMYQLP